MTRLPESSEERDSKCGSPSAIIFLVAPEVECMTRLEQIVEEARSLSIADKRELRRLLDLDIQQPECPQTSQSVSGHKDDECLRQERLQWLKSHREEYAGQYVALDGTVLVGHGPTIRDAHEQARQNGVENPFLVRLSSESEVLFAGW